MMLEERTPSLLTLLSAHAEGDAPVVPIVLRLPTPTPPIFQLLMTPRRREK